MIFLVQGTMISVRYIGGVIKSTNRYPVHKDVTANNSTDALFILMNKAYENMISGLLNDVPVIYYFENMNAEQIV